MRAVGLDRIERRGANPTLRIYLTRYRLKVIWVDATSDAAQMIYLQSRRNRASIMFIDEPMHSMGLAINIGAAVSFWINKPIP